jgi:peptidyl-tRNA hydrolase, PTH1 family
VLYLSLMKLIIGLGNPGDKYNNNRHNVGHVVVDEIKRQKAKGKNITAKKTDCFMNESGACVKRLVSKYPNISISSDLYVIHDDLDIKLGEYKIQFGKGPKVHHGIESVDEALGTRDYWRVRVGVDNRSPENRIPGEVYVLQDFSPDEKIILDKVLSHICKKLATL